MNKIEFLSSALKNPMPSETSPDAEGTFSDHAKQHPTLRDSFTAADEIVTFPF